jgi:phosphoglycolate phosphatase/pyrophosphatase PpaX
MLPDAIYDYDLPSHQRKPNPYALNQIMEQFQLKPEEILMVDDMKLGCLMAQSVGAHTGFAAWSKQEFPALWKVMESLCDYTFKTAEELEAFLFE